MKKIIVTVAALAVVAVAVTACDVPEDGPATSGSHAVQKAKGEEKVPDMTPAQSNAVESAQSYLDMSGFSRAGLIGQLTSKAADGYKLADATFAVNHIKVDWNKEAVEAGKSYLDMSGFSRDGLIGQLTSKAGDEFTQEQAVYAVNKLGL